ncbi:MAG: prephenate dehydratase domain-containing protein [bacterium]
MKKVAYSGVEGAFAHAAARRMFPDALHVSCRNFREAYEAVVGGACDAAVFPVENSYAGRVREVAELLSEGKLCVDAELSLPIVQNLLGVRGSRIDDIKKVISHQKALEQCDDYLKERGYEVEEAVNTAVAAKRVAREQKMSVAAIASLEVAAIYGLKVLAERINTRDDNMTRFVAVSKSEESGKERMELANAG